MNILPNSFLTSPILNAAVAAASAASSNPALLKQQNVTLQSLQASVVPSPSAALSAIITPKSGDRVCKCVVCEDPLHESDPQLFQMLAVRPSIGTPAGPFFPILETLTSTSAVRVPCCAICAQSLLDQWNDYEAKNVSINNRVYNLQAKFAARFQAKSAGPSGATPLFLLQQHQVLVNNGTTPPAVAAMADSNSRPSSSSRDSSPQDEVLDLSMPSGAPSTPATPSSPQNLSRTNSGSSGQSGKVANVLPFGPSVGASSTSRSGSSQPPSQLPQSRTVSLELAAAAVQSLPQFFNSSMTNLIKVTSNPVSLTALKPSSFAPPPTPVLDNHPQPPASTPSPSSAKKPLFCCSLCDDTCTQLVPILLRPIANCPYFPTLISYVKSPQIDSNGRINVCESCHRQLFQQWDVFQKQNKPVSERFYKLIKSSKPNAVLSFPFRSDLQSSSAAGIFSHPGSAATSNVGILHSNHHIPSISSQSTATQQVCAVTRALFTCVSCGKDLLFEAASTLADHEPNSNAHLVFSMLTEPTSSREPAAVKKLVIQSAQEFSMLPFMPNANSTPAPIQPQLAMLIESGRVLCCFPCFESITSLRSSATASLSFNSSSNSTVPESVQKTVAGRSHRDPVNGNHVVKSSSHESSAADIAATYLCLACNTNKAQQLVETKENSVKEPFFPFLRDPNEPHGRARLCAACHLILETQWDAHEAGYVPYSQRTYGLPRPGSNGPNMSSSSTNLILSKRPPLHHSHGGSSSPVVLANQVSVSSAHSNGQPTPPPLKIQISSPSVVVSAGVATSVNNTDNGHLLLTTVNNNNSTTNSAATQLSAGVGPVAHPEAQMSTETSTVSSSSDRAERPNVDHELIFQTINEFITQLGGPQSHISGNCVICGEYNQPGEAYQIFSNQQKVIISPELGQLPFFPMLKGLGAGPKKLKADNTHITCIFCYNSLIAQWAAYHASNFAEDRDPSTRIYNCRDFICFVCGVTTYRSLVRSISVKDFPFLVDHKRPPGSLSMHKGESVVTCLNCFDTLTHQWIENERMKVPLEMRQYNWMPVPQPPPPTTTNDAQSTHSDSSRSTPSNHLAILNHNGMTSGAMTLVTKSLPSSSAVTTIQGLMPGGGSNDTNSARTGGTPIVTFNPSHTLAPLVAAAMAATPAVTHKESAHANLPSDNFSATMSASSATFAEALRALARRHMHSTFPAVLKSSEPVPTAPTANVLALNSSNHVNHNSNQPQSTAANHSINLSTLASVAAMAGSCHHSRHSSTETITTATTATVTTPNHAFVLNLASLPTADGRPHLLANHHGHPGEQKFILATTATPEQLTENGRTNGRFLLNSGANGGNLIIQFSGGNTRVRESPSSTTTEHRPHNHHHHGHALAIHKSAHCPINSHGTRDHHVGKGHSASMRALSRLQTSVARATDSPERRTTDSPEISHYDKSLSKVGLEVSKLRRKRLARHQQLQQSFLRMKRARLSSLENSSELSGDEDLEFVDDEEDEDDEQSTEEDVFGGESLLKFVESILPPLPMDENPRKLSFLKAFGLTTRKVLQKQEFNRYFNRIMNRRISLKLSLVEEDEDSVLTKDVDDLGRIESSGILPTDNQLAAREEEKAEFMDALDLVPIEDEELVLKRELSWLAVIQERKIRRRRGYHFTRPLVNNFSNAVLRNWLPKLAGKCDLDNALLRLDEDETDEQKLINSMQPLLDVNYEEIGEPKPSKRAKASSPEVTFVGHGSSHSHNQHITSTISRADKHRADNQHNPCLERSIKSPRSTASNDNRNQHATALSNQNHSSSQPQMLHHLPTSKLINSKQFAQEFHDSVLQETKMKMTHKQLSVNNIEPVSTAGNNGHHQPVMAHQNAQTPYHHTIIYSDSLRPNHDCALNHNHNHSDRPAPNSAPPVPTSGTMFRFPEKIGQMQEQMRKLQQKLAQISQETQYLAEKKNEIETSLHKLDEERSSCQAEMERLAQCLENSIV